MLQTDDGFIAYKVHTLFSYLFYVNCFPLQNEK